MVYRQPPTTFEQMVAPFPESIQQTAEMLRQVISSTLPQLTETIYGGNKIANALYSFDNPNQVVCGIQANEKVCKLFVHFYDQVQGMGFAIDGTGKHARHIKFSPSEDIDQQALAGVLKVVWQSSGY